MPRISAGGPLAHGHIEIDDGQITRVDISPEDIRKMSDEDLHSLLASIRNKRETAAPRASRAKSGGASTPLREVESGDMEEME